MVNLKFGLLYYLTLIAIRYDFKFIDVTLLDDYDEVKKEIEPYKQPSANLIAGEIVLNNAPDSLLEYWNKNLKNKKPLIQLDALKNLCIYSLLHSALFSGRIFAFDRELALRSWE